MGHGGVEDVARVLAVAGWTLRVALAAVGAVLSGPWAVCQAVDAVAARVTAMRTTETIRVDGRLDEPALRDTARLSRFVQREPVQGGEPSEETEIRVLFTDRRYTSALSAMTERLTRLSRPRCHATPISTSTTV